MRIDKFGLNLTVLPSRLVLFFFGCFLCSLSLTKIKKPKKRRPGLCGSITKDSIEKLILIGHSLIGSTKPNTKAGLLFIAWHCLGT